VQSLREGVLPCFRAVPPFLAPGRSGRGPGGSAGGKLPLPRPWWQQTGGPGGVPEASSPFLAPGRSGRGGQGVVPEASSPFLTPGGSGRGAGSAGGNPPLPRPQRGRGRGAGGEGEGALAVLYSTGAELDATRFRRVSVHLRPGS